MTVYQIKKCEFCKFYKIGKTEIEKSVGILFSRSGDDVDHPVDAEFIG